MRHLLLKLSMAAAGMAAALTGAKAAAFPTKPVRIVIPFAAGGTADPLARILTEVIDRKTGAKFVIDSRPGAGGNIGTEAASRAPRDGYRQSIS